MLENIPSSVLNLSFPRSRGIQESGTWRESGLESVFGVRGHIDGNSNHERGQNDGGEREE